MGWNNFNSNLLYSTQSVQYALFNRTTLLTRTITLQVQGTRTVVDVLDALFSVQWDRCESPHNVFVKSVSQPKALVRKFEYLFLTDRSCGHDRKRPDGLDVMSLRKGPTSAAKRNSYST